MLPILEVMAGGTGKGDLATEKMLETQPLCAGAKSNLRGRTWGEIEKNSFIALPGKGKQSRLMPSELCGGSRGGNEFYSNCSKRQV